MPFIALNLCPCCFLNKAYYGTITKGYHWWQKQHKLYDYVQHRTAALPLRDCPLLLPPSVYQIPSHSHPYSRKVSVRQRPLPVRLNP